jgi:hypothetical protein
MTDYRRVLMHELGVNIMFSKAQMSWDNGSIPKQATKKLETILR